MISVYADDEDTVAKAIHILTVERDLSVESRNATIHFCLSDTVPNMLDWLSVVDFWDRRRLSGAELRNRDVPEGTPEAYVWPTYSDAVEGVVRFLADRLKVQLREQGKRHDLVDAVFALGDDDLVRIVARVEALDAFLKTEDGANLLAGYKRAANILAAEEKKGRGLSEQDAAGSVQAGLLKEDAEKALATALDKTAPAAQKAVAAEDFAGAMSALSSLRAPVDAFFDAVLVNSDDNLLRRNRLLLLRDIRDALNAVADFSKIEG